MPLKFELLKAKPKSNRIDLLLAIVLYPLAFFPSVNLMSQAWLPEPVAESTNATFSFITDHLDVEMLQPHTFQVLLPFVLIAIHALFYLFTVWSFSFRIKMLYVKADEKSATHVAFYPKKHKGQAQIVPLMRDRDVPYTMYQQKKREFIDGEFKPLKYPNNLTIQEYIDSRGLLPHDIQPKTDYYGLNNYNFPVPTFWELLKEHMLAPLFIFQIFSISCWILDEYITFPLMSIIGSIFIEANTVRTRQHNLQELRGVETEEIQLLVQRDTVWKLMPSSKLLPGDLVVLDRTFEAPADILLLSGRAVVNEAMLTGESTPQVKECVTTLDRNHRLDISTDKRYIIFGGTKIEQVISGESHVFIPREGCLGYVLSTGLGSSQGKLLRTIVFASQRVAVESQDSTKLLLFLTVFAIVASSYVIYYGRQSMTISSFRLIVEVVKIITSTIPPDLPMELTFAVNASLLALSKLSVFCTEPFRIPFAGTVSVCCFDKTGTLTAEEYQLLGIDEMSDSAPEVTRMGVTGRYTTEPDKLRKETHLVVGGCHSLVRTPGGGLIGDSLEAAAFKALGFTVTQSNNMKNKQTTLSTVRTFHFSAELRRMSCIVQMNNSKQFYVVAKGAPEVIAEHLTEVPEHYTETYRSYTKQGCRVLALAYRQLPNDGSAMSIDRTAAETGLTFVGFTIFGAPFKRGTEDTIVELLQSTHRVVVITGDDPLTASHVATRLHILTEDAVIADEEIPENATCYTGRALEKIMESGDEKKLEEVCRNVNVFARMSPNSKALVVQTLSHMGYKTLMCGDGTNDVGALKQAEVGVGIIENGASMDNVKEDEEQYMPKLGAASIAAPFVSKRATISACVDIIRFGRATLSSTIDLFKQLSLTCLINAYASSVLFIENVKFGDRQMTIISIVMAVAFMAISLAKPTRTLSKERPFDSQFNPYLVSSVLFQFAVHFALLIYTKKLVFATGYQTPPFDYKVKFTPSLMNTAMFIVVNQMQITTFLANYRGKPFMQSFLQNKAMCYSVMLAEAILIACLAGLNPVLREIFELVEFPDTNFQASLVAICVIDVVACIAIEKICLYIFTRGLGEELVSKETLEAIEDYEPNEDDVLPEESHKFTIIDMFKENYALQKEMIVKDSIKKREKQLIEYNMKKGMKAKDAKKAANRKVKLALSKK